MIHLDSWSSREGGGPGRTGVGSPLGRSLEREIPWNERHIMLSRLRASRVSSLCLELSVDMAFMLALC